MSAAASDHGPGGSAKWGDAARAGFQVVPDVLFIKQHELGLDTTDVVVVLNFASFWWFRDAPPFPRSNIIAKRMGVTQRTVQRSMKKLESKGYLKRGEFNDGAGSIMPAVYFDGLIDKLVDVTKSDAALSIRFMRSAAPLEFAGGEEIPF